MIHGEYSARKNATRHGARPKAWRSRAIAAALAAVAVVAGGFVAVSSAQAATHTFVINSLLGTTAAADANPGNGICATSTGVCTMQAALQELNALNLPAGSVEITVDPGLSGNLQPSVRMRITSASNQDTLGTYFQISAPVEIDLNNQITIDAQSDTAYGLFYVDSADVTFLNTQDLLSGESSIIASPNAKRLTIDGGRTVSQNNYFAERFLVIREGAEDITVKNYQLQGFYDSTTSGLFYFDLQSNTAAKNILIDNVAITYTTGTTCTASNGSGCRTHIVNFNNWGTARLIDGFTFKNSLVSNLTDKRAFPFATATGTASSAVVSNITITDNQFINVQGQGTGSYNAFITLPNGTVGGTNTISGNEFVRGTSGQTYAISWNGAKTDGSSAGNVRIAENYFNGYSGSSVYLVNTGNVPVEKNTFGARSASQARPAVNEETLNSTGTLLNNALNANGRVNTWYPSADATALVGATPPGAVEAVSPLPAETPVCIATVQVQAPSANPIPNNPVNLDMYWTADRTAEVFLGRAQVTSGNNATLLLRLPVGPQTFPNTIVGGTESVTIVDQTTGIASGYVRLQTVSSATGQSSQYSRIVGFSGSCRPEVTLNQASNQNDPTLARDLHYTLTSTVPLDPASVTPDKFNISATAISQTYKSALINPRVVSVTPVAGSENRAFTVIARVDDSADVTLALPAERVRTDGNLTNRVAAAFTDNKITFHNPVQIIPSQFTIVTGEPNGEQYRLNLATGAPEPTAGLSFTSTLDQAGIDHGVNLSTATPTIAAAATQSQLIQVTADEGAVTPNTPVVVSATVASPDTNYDGLVVPDLTVSLFSTNPQLQITKKAYVDVGDSSSPSQIEATGTEAAIGGRLLEGQTVCFVYTVTNLSTDVWASQLKDIEVTDTDTRLGAAGLIGVVDALDIGESKKVSACAALIPVDTTTGGTP